MKALNKPTLIMVRHGTTDMNIHNELRGWDDPELDEQGHRDAGRAAEHIANLDIPVYHVYSGTLARTKQTGQHIATKLGVGQTETVGLNPWDYGDLTGQKEDHKQKKKLKFLQQRPNIPAPNGESYNSFISRYSNVLNRAKHYVHLYPEKALVLVTHSRNLYPTENILDSKSKIPVHDKQFGPGTVHKIEFDGDRHKMTKIGG